MQGPWRQASNVADASWLAKCCIFPGGSNEFPRCSTFFLASTVMALCSNGWMDGHTFSPTTLIQSRFTKLRTFGLPSNHISRYSHASDLNFFFPLKFVKKNYLYSLKQSRFTLFQNTLEQKMHL